MDNVPTQSYAPEGNELIPGDNTSYFNGLRRAARVYVSLSIMGLTEDRITERFLSYVRVIGCSSIPSEAWPVFRVVSTSREKSAQGQFRNFERVERRSGEYSYLPRFPSGLTRKCQVEMQR